MVTKFKNNYNSRKKAELEAQGSPHQTDILNMPIEYYIDQDTQEQVIIQSKPH